MNDAWVTLEDIQNHESKGLINFDIKINEKYEKLIGKNNEMFEDGFIDDLIDKKNKEITHNLKPSFTKYNLYVYFLQGKFSTINNMFTNENIRFRIYLNPNYYEESFIQLKNNNTSIFKEIHFQLNLPGFIERIIIEFYHKEYLFIFLYLN